MTGEKELEAGSSTDTSQTNRNYKSVIIQPMIFFFILVINQLDAQNFVL